ncbi:MAG: prepilin-type N-terminal cleavage/methylation domain-containing protein [Planctomycetota bacterium]|nr:prepilin-type N-terminal cleavage/methylation domain-containing protein [Planctomycetota bacterium]
MRLHAPRIRRRAAARAMTLLEAMVATVILAVLLGGVFSFLVSARDHFESVTIESDLRDRSRIVMDFICTELRQASAATVEINDSPTTLSGSKIAFKKAIGFAGGALQVGPANAFTWVLSPDAGVPGEEETIEEGYIRYSDGIGDRDLNDNCSALLEGEVEDGIDNNGNGAADEKGLYFQRKTDATNKIVPEAIVRLTLIKRDRYRRVIYETSSEAAITFRNP